METLTEILGLSVHDMGNGMEKTIEQHRAEFEELAEEQGYDLYRHLDLDYQPIGEYTNLYTRQVWLFFKAARGIKE